MESYIIFNLIYFPLLPPFSHLSTHYAIYDYLKRKEPLFFERSGHRKANQLIIPPRKSYNTKRKV